MKNPNNPDGFILYRGPSVLDGAPIVVIATMSSQNVKTGKRGKKNMIQTWILREDISPLEASKKGLDSSICGSCVHRHSLGGACYVTIFQAPLSIWKAYKRGSYSESLGLFHSLVFDRKVRFGAYGDPSAAPVYVWAEIAKRAQGFTGYTHQMMHPNFDESILSFVMASVDTEEQALATNARYFRVKRPEDKALPREVECLSDSIGKTCADCLLCDGGTKGKSVYINVHGSKAKAYNPDLIAVAA